MSPAIKTASQLQTIQPRGWHWLLVWGRSCARSYSSESVLASIGGLPGDAPSAPFGVSAWEDEDSAHALASAPQAAAPGEPMQDPSSAEMDDDMKDLAAAAARNKDLHKLQSSGPFVAVEGNSGAVQVRMRVGGWGAEWALSCIGFG